MANVKALRQIGRYMARLKTSKADMDHSEKGAPPEVTEVEKSQTGEAFLVSQVKNLELYA